MSQQSFIQKTALVTGGCGGLGRAIAEAFLLAGANVVVCDINAELIADFKEKVSAAYPECTLAVQADITKDESVEQVFSQGEKMFGGLDFVINCAGRIDRFDAVAEMVRARNRSPWYRYMTNKLTCDLHFPGQEDVGQCHRLEPDCSSHSEWPRHQAVAERRQKGQHRQHRLDRRNQRWHFGYVSRENSSQICAFASPY